MTLSSSVGRTHNVGPSSDNSRFILNKKCPKNASFIIKSIQVDEI